MSKSGLSNKYRAMIYFAVATMHFYREDLAAPPAGGIIEDYEDFAKNNSDVMKRVFDEALRYFHYELSHEQMSRAVRAYLMPSCRLTDKDNHPPAVPPPDAP